MCTAKVFSTIRRFVPVALALGFHGAFAGDWPQFQGPNRNGISLETGLARSWAAGGPETLWRHPLGEGFGGAAIRDGEVYLLNREENKRDILLCLSLESGEELWRYAYDARGKVAHNGSRATPLVTETHVFTVGMTGQFHCIDRKTHRPAWRIELAKAFPPVDKPRWGYSQSPSAYKDLVVVAPQSSNAFVAAFKQSDGEVAWATKLPGGVGYSSPLVTTLGGMDQAVMITAEAGGKPGGVVGLSMEDGHILWNYHGWACRIPIPFPTPIPGNRLFITGEYGAGSAMIELDRRGNRFAVIERFRTREAGSQIHQPLLSEDHLYLNSNGNRRNDGMLCLTLEGERLWRTRDTKGLPRFARGNAIMADRLILNLDGKTGVLHLIEPSSHGYRELASTEVFDGREMWSPMAFSQGLLVLRSQEEVHCLDLRSP